MAIEPSTFENTSASGDVEAAGGGIGREFAHRDLLVRPESKVAWARGCMGLGSGGG